MIERAIIDFIDFVKNPKFDFKRDQSESFVNITVLFFMIFVCEMIIASVLFTLIGLDENQHKLTELFANMPYWKIFLLAVIIAPFFEEFIFRFHLRYPIFSLIFFVFAFIMGGIWTFINGYTWAAILIATVAITLTIGILMANSHLEKKPAEIYKRHFNIFLYLSAIIFALVHIGNFEEGFPLYTIPILVLPQFIIGVYLAYVRVRTNIWMSIYVHALNNSIPMLLLMLAPEGSLG